ncbi:MAG TPA: PEPxxWA-CTERM sorting domain-containing protein [Sphingomonas sp.]|jgi:hypothetical protein
MRTALGMITVLTALATPSVAGAATVFDAAGDFLPSYTGSKDADMDVLSFSVSYDAISQLFTVGATLAGAIDPAKAGFYVIGVDLNGAGNAPFATLGAPNVRFNRVIQIQKSGTGTIGGGAIRPGDITISGSSFSFKLAASALNSGALSAPFAPVAYGWNLWPRNNSGITDFAPNNALITGAVPEPASWAMMILGMGAIGSVLRRRGSTRAQSALAA